MFNNLIISEINFSDIALLKQFKDQLGEQPKEIIRYEESIRYKNINYYTIHNENIPPVKIFFKLKDFIDDRNIRLVQTSSTKIEQILILNEDDYNILINDIDILARVCDAIDTVRMHTLIKTLLKENKKNSITDFIKKSLSETNLYYNYNYETFIKHLIRHIYTTPEYLKDMIENGEVFVYLSMYGIYCTNIDSNSKENTTTIQTKETLKYLISSFLNENSPSKRVIEDADKMYNIIRYLNQRDNWEQVISISEKETDVFVKNFLKHISNIKTSRIRSTKKEIKKEAMVLISQMNKNGVLNIVDNSQSLKTLLKWIQSDDLSVQISLNKVVVNVPILYKYISKYLLYIDTILKCGRLYPDAYYEKVLLLTKSPIIKFDSKNCKIQLKEYYWNTNNDNLIKAIKNIKETETNAINSLISILSSDIKIHDLDDIKAVEKYC